MLARAVAAPPDSDPVAELLGSSDASVTQAVARCQDGLDAVAGTHTASQTICHAPAAAACVESSVVVHQMKIQVVHFDPSRSGCVVSLMPADDGRNYREVIHSQRGGLTYFDNATGAAWTYQLFPRRGVPTVKSILDQAQLTTVSGDLIYFDAAHPLKPGSAGLSPAHAGLPHSLVLDLGVNHGNSPTMNQDLTSTFYDPHGNKCSVSNHEIFRYDYLQSGPRKGFYRDTKVYNKWDPAPKYPTDSALWSFLESRCPALKLPRL